MHFNTFNVDIHKKLSEQWYEFIINRLITNDFNSNCFHKVFKTSDEINVWGKKYFEYFDQKKTDFINNFHKDREYHPITVFKWYCGYYYEKVNGTLRGVDDYQVKQLEQYTNCHIETINNELMNFSLESNVVVMRRVSNYCFNNFLTNSKSIRKGDIISDKAFLSATLNLSLRLDNEGMEKSFENETILIIKVKRGTRAIYLEPISKRNEYELLLPSNLKLQVEKKFRFLTNRIVVLKTL